MSGANASMRWTASALGVCVALAGGCGSSQEEVLARDRMAQARATYQQALDNPTVQANAPVPLMEAGKSLRTAGATSDPGEQAHLAYVAERQSRIAMAVAQAREAEKQMEQLTKETNEVVIQKREREAALARRDAEMKRREITEAQARLDAQTRDLEQARQRMQLQAQEIEKGRREVTAAQQHAQQSQIQAAATAQETQRLQREISELKAKQTDRGVVLTLGDVLFATGRAEVAPGAMRGLDQLAAFLQANPTRNVLIEGYTDNTGSADRNLDLSQRRADAVRMALLKKGVSAERISTKGYGEEYPVAPNDSASGRQQNRRVEIVVLNEGVSPGSATR